MAVSINRDSLRYFVIVNVLPDWFKSVKFNFFNRLSVSMSKEK